MKYVSKEILESIDPWDYETPQQLIMDIIDKCEELPDQQWQTIDEFKANPVKGWCWIQHKSLKTTMAHYKRVFTVNGEMFSDGYITHVMPIKTPKAPK